MIHHWLKNLYRFIVGILFFVPTVSHAQISTDAVELTLRIQSGIVLDSVTAQSIDSSLAIARTINDTLLKIHAFPQFAHDRLTISTDAPWSAAWLKEELWTGNPAIDALGAEYGLTKVDTLYRPPPFRLTFGAPMHMKNLAKLYAAIELVNYANPSYYGGDGDNIEFFRKGDTDYIAFSDGSGDCPAGCTKRYYWYVSVHRTGNSLNAIVEESGYRIYMPKFYRWNIPARYAVTMFPDFDSLLSAITVAKEWWIRRHAIEGVKLLYQNNSPWVGEDLNRTLWDTLRNQAHARKHDVIFTLNIAIKDPDPDVQRSAGETLSRLLSVNTGSDIPRPFLLEQNFPNPFNPSTIIRYRLLERKTIALSVFDLLGREVAVLVNGEQEPGEHQVEFAPDRISGGIYLYRLSIDGHSIVKKMLFMK